MSGCKAPSDDFVQCKSPTAATRTSSVIRVMVGSMSRAGAAAWVVRTPERPPHAPARGRRTRLLLPHAHDLRACRLRGARRWGLRFWALYGHRAAHPRPRHLRPPTPPHETTRAPPTLGLLHRHP